VIIGFAVQQDYLGDASGLYDPVNLTGIAAFRKIETLYELARHFSLM
jgi:hypothetical protein